MLAFDIETISTDIFHDEFALQPWNPQTEISVMTTFDGMDTGRTVTDMATLKNQFVWTWNGCFDVAFLIAKGFDCSGIRWLDAMSALKWWSRSQETDPPDGKPKSWSLVDAVERHIMAWAKAEEFVSVKRMAEQSIVYWKSRCLLDAEATWLIGAYCWKELSIQERRGFLVEQQCIYPVAKALIRGCCVDIEAIKQLRIAVDAEKRTLLSQLSIPEIVLSSPVKLAAYIYTKVGCESFTAKGNPSIDNVSLMKLIYKYPNLPELGIIKKYRKLQTTGDKFIKSVLSTHKYLNSNIFRHHTKLNSTYTGRCTVSSKTGGMSVGLPFHQIPKKVEHRKNIVAPGGYQFLIADVNSQETKLMTEFSKDPEMLRIYSHGLNPHAHTAEMIFNIPYSDILAHKGGMYADQYKGGKVTDLGGNFRMGAGSLLDSAFEWGLTPTLDITKTWVRVWRGLYSGIVQQWNTFINLARSKGYSESLAGRRFYINRWDNKTRWASESSAIMQPIQGSGADMKYLAIAVIRYMMPQLEFSFEMHDEVAWLLPINYDPEEFGELLKGHLDNLPYKQAWNWEPQLSFTWTVSHGLNWGELKEIV